MWLFEMIRSAADAYRTTPVMLNGPQGPQEYPLGQLPVSIGVLALSEIMGQSYAIFQPGGMDRVTFERLDMLYRKGRLKKRKVMRSLRETPWTPFVKDDSPQAAPQDSDEGDWKALWSNSRYHVLVYQQAEGGITWLSIRRNDREPIWEWREMQRVKNEIMGPEYEAVQIFPVESRLVDTANQMHLWVLPQGERLPFGMGERMVSEGSFGGSVQEPFDPDCRPDDVITPDDIDPELIERFRKTGPAGFRG